MNRADICAGTRPEIQGGKNKIIMTGASGFDGYEIMEYMGMVWGISIRAKDMGQDCMMGCKSLLGGELASYTELGHESRQRAVSNMLVMAARQKANGVINVSFELTGAASGAAEVVVYGTAVKIKPIKNYVPTGALGNIMADMLDHFQGDEDPEPSPWESKKRSKL